MHQVCKNIRDPKLWVDVPQQEMFGLYSQWMDRRVTAVFKPEREKSVVKTRESVVEPLVPR